MEVGCKAADPVAANAPSGEHTGGLYSRMYDVEALEPVEGRPIGLKTLATSERDEQHG